MALKAPSLPSALERTLWALFSLSKTFREAVESLPTYRDLVL
jgi:hypothetical protein